MIVRRLETRDAAAYRDIRLRSLRDHPAAYGSTVADWQDAPLDHFHTSVETRLIFGLFSDSGDLVGLAASDRERGGNTRHRSFVTDVYVAPEARGKGGARLLLQAIAEQSKADGVLQLELHVAEDNAPATAAYIQAGYTVQGRSPRAIFCSGRFVDEVLMVRFLDAPVTG